MFLYFVVGVRNLELKGCIILDILHDKSTFTQRMAEQQPDVSIKSHWEGKTFGASEFQPTIHWLDTYHIGNTFSKLKLFFFQPHLFQFFYLANDGRPLAIDKDRNPLIWQAILPALTTA